MKRRKFLSKLGIASGVAVVAPLSVSSFSPKKIDDVSNKIRCSDSAGGKCTSGLGKIKGLYIMNPKTGDYIKLE